MAADQLPETDVLRGMALTVSRVGADVVRCVGMLVAGTLVLGLRVMGTFVVGLRVVGIFVVRIDVGARVRCLEWL